MEKKIALVGGDKVVNVWCVLLFVCFLLVMREVSDIFLKSVKVLKYREVCTTLQSQRCDFLFLEVKAGKVSTPHLPIKWTLWGVLTTGNLLPQRKFWIIYQNGFPGLWRRGIKKTTTTKTLEFHLEDMRYDTYLCVGLDYQGRF